MFRNAMVSACGRHRYLLTRVWDPTLPMCVYVMLNPSTADGTVDDPTVRKCIRFAMKLGFGGMRIVNLFTYRTPSPEVLRADGYPNGTASEFVIDHVFSDPAPGKEIICAWGRHEFYRPVKQRAIHVVERARLAGFEPKVLAWTKGDPKFDKHVAPRHPLMLPYSAVDDGLKPLGPYWPWKEKFE